MRKIICDRCGQEPKEKFFPLVVGADPQQNVDLCLPCSDAFRLFIQNGRQSPQDAPQRIATAEPSTDG